MSPQARRIVVLVLVLLLLLAGAVFLVRCRATEPTAAPAAATAAPAPDAAPAATATAAPAVKPAADDESEAKLTAADSAILGSALSVTWTGPNNPRDYITIVPKGTPEGRYGNTTDTKRGSPLTVRVPVEPGDAELRYMTAAGKVLGRRELKVVMPETTIDAPAEVTAGKTFQVTWKGPANPEDYLTIVPKGTPDGQYRNHTDTAKGSPLSLRALIEEGEAELRYMTGQDAKVLARRDIKIVAAKVTLEGPAEAVAGSPVKVQWEGPNNEGDYVTIVTSSTPDGQYAKYADTKKGAQLTVEAPIDAGPAEIRYMAGQGAKVLARRPIAIVAANPTLEAPERVIAGASFRVVWTGPNNRGDYITIVPQTLPDGRYENYADTSKGSPLNLTALITPGEAELRYMSGQGAKVLARRPITIAAAKITLDAPAEVAAGAPVSISCDGPNHRGDYITIVPKAAADSQHGRYKELHDQKVVVVEAPREAGPAEIRYISGQGSKVLARRDLTVTPAKLSQAE